MEADLQAIPSHLQMVLKRLMTWMEALSWAGSLERVHFPLHDLLPGLCLHRLKVLSVSYAGLETPAACCEMKLLQAPAEQGERQCKNFLYRFLIVEQDGRFVTVQLRKKCE